MIKLRPSVHFAPLGDGVFFKNWDASFKIAGHPALYAIFERFLPHLERGVERKALLAAVPDKARAVVEKMLDQLDEHGMFVDLSNDADGGGEELPPACARTMAYLEGVAEDPRAAFARLRSARIALLGTGQAQLAAARALAGMHVGELVCFTDAAHARVLEDELAGHPLVARQIHELDRETTWNGTYTLVVHLQDGADADELARIAARVRSPFLQAAIGDDLAVVGPLREGAGGLEGALARLRAPLRGGRARSPLLEGLVGNVVALEAVKIAAGLSSPTQQGRCAIVTGSPLAASFHALPPRAPSLPVAEAARQLLAESVGKPALGRAALVAELQALADERVGLIGLPHPDELPQLPVFTQPALAGDETVFGYSEQMEEAYVRAGLEAVRRLAAGRAPRELPLFTVGGEARPPIESTFAHLAAASGWNEWLAAGVLGFLLDRLAGDPLPALAPQAIEEPFTGLTPRARLHVKTLAARFGRDVQVTRVVHAELPGVHLAVVRVDGDVAGLGAAFDRAPALEQALLEAVARVQLEEAGLTLPARPALPAFPAATTTHEAAGTLDAVLARLGELGLEVLVHPWGGEPALPRHGIFSGWVSIHAR